MPLLGSVERRVMRAALAKCGMRRQRSAMEGSRNGESAGRGSFSYTSRAAPAIQFSRSAFTRTQQRHVHADEIGFAQCIFEAYVLDPVLIFGNAAGVAQVHGLLNGFY